MKQKKSASILKKFLIINLTVFSVLGLFTIIYLEAIQPTLVKKIVKEAMTSVSSSDHHMFSIPLEVSINSGNNWGEAH